MTITPCEGDDRVRIMEVGPRDGLQNEAVTISTATKLELIKRLVACRIENVEVTSFVSPRWVPQMADHSEIASSLRHDDAVFTALTPNFKGFETALASGMREVAVFTAASEGFCRRNVNCSIEESIDRFIPIFKAAHAARVQVRGYVSCVVACPYDGVTEPERVAEVAQRLVDLGCHEISLGDTTGVGTPASILRMLETVARYVPCQQLAGHFHDTYGMGVTNVYAAWQFGLRVFDTSIAGLGGCPYAKGASGNVATEDVVYMLEGLDIKTGIDLPKLVESAVWISQKLGREPVSRVTRAMTAAS